MALGAALGLGLVARDAAALCVAGVALCSNGINIGVLATKKGRRGCRMPVSTLPPFMSCKRSTFCY